jgi:DNA-binding MarR family transcriptional regulator/N-acetylglutamate synthase-like GNAT family acetyltransferase
MVMEFIKELETLAFGTRLKQLTERLSNDAAKVYKQLNIKFEPRWFTFFYLLYKRAPISITEISVQLGFSQPAATQLADILIKEGLIKNVKDSDTRKRLLTLSEKGKRMIPILQPVWDAFDSATKELFLETGFDALLVIDKLEKALDEKTLSFRITEKVKQSQSECVEIINFGPEYKLYFRDLNYEWLNKYFSVEEQDKQILENPEREIINKGGEILFAKKDDEIIGTVAMIRHSNNIYELAKMAVAEKSQGKQIGKKLALSAIELAKSKNAKKIFLETSKKLTAACNLYSKLGFEQVPYPEGEQIKYRRCTIKMELELSN